MGGQKRSYKTLFNGITWKEGRLSDLPWRKVYVDGDSMVFRYMREFVESDLDMSFFMKLVGARIRSLDTAIHAALYAAASRATTSLSLVLRRLDVVGYDVMLVFGKGHIKRKLTLVKEREDNLRQKHDTLSSLFPRGACKMPGTTMLNESLRSAIKSYILASRDPVRDLVKSMMKAKSRIYVENIEPDMYCSRMSRVVVTEDFDHILFGAGIIMKELDADNFKYLHVEDILRFVFGSDVPADVSTLIKACVLCGTDYNEGIPGIGPANAKRIVITDPSDPQIDKDVVLFFEINHGRGEIGDHQIELFAVFDPESHDLLALYTDFSEANRRIDSFLGGVDPVPFEVDEFVLESGIAYVVTGYENNDEETVFHKIDDAICTARYIYDNSPPEDLKLQGTPDVLQVRIDDEGPPMLLLSRMSHIY